MSRLLVPAAAALAVLALSAQPGANPAADTPALPSRMAGPAEVRLAPDCHFLRVVPAPDVDPRFVWPAPDRALSGVMVPGPDGSRRVVPLGVTPEPAPRLVAPNGDTCHPAPALAPLQRTTP